MYYLSFFHMNMGPGQQKLQEYTKNNRNYHMFIPRIPSVWSSCRGKYSLSSDVLPALRPDCCDRFWDWVWDAEWEAEWEEWDGWDESAETWDRLSLSLRQPGVAPESRSRSFISSSCCSCDIPPVCFSSCTVWKKTPEFYIKIFLSHCLMDTLWRSCIKLFEL